MRNSASRRPTICALSWICSQIPISPDRHGGQSRPGPLISDGLADGPLRYAEINRIISNVSPTMLTPTLRTLEHGGLLERRITAEVPVRVDHERTPLGHSPQPVMRAIKDVGRRARGRSFRGALALRR
ncbi:winged helix-turn-helix transcriptional regulator [Nocardia sp. CA-119907]|uniref:winged helix-turn-helix transcriptional regulator n=1 Tax=Nocardia sp. CA-119907 TaxID=3239973 RepID=UPI003D987E9E